jgi:hypothetical protein
MSRMEYHRTHVHITAGDSVKMVIYMRSHMQKLVLP